MGAVRTPSANVIEVRIWLQIFPGLDWLLVDEVVATVGNSKNIEQWGQAGSILGATGRPGVLMTRDPNHLSRAFRHSTSLSKSLGPALEISRRVRTPHSPDPGPLWSLPKSPRWPKAAWGLWQRGWSNRDPRLPLELEVCNVFSRVLRLPLIHINRLTTFSYPVLSICCIYNYGKLAIR